MRKHRFLSANLWVAGLLWLGACAVPPPLAEAPTAEATRRATAPPTPLATSTAESAGWPIPTLAGAVQLVAPTASPAPLVQTEPTTITLLFTGDINPGRCPAQISIANNDFTLPYQAIGPDLRLADLTVGSLDGSISDLSPPSPCPQTMNLIGPARVVEGLSFAGFDVITVATNHAKDCGRLGFGCDHRAFLDTLQHLRAGGIWPVGGGGNLAEARAPVSLTARGTRFAFLGVNEIAAGTWATADEPGTAPLSAETLAAVLADIRAAAQQAEVVIVLAQWGVEYTDFPADYQRAWAAQMITAGATLVIGNHPHLIQPIEEITRPDGAVGVVAYALGNFIFDQGPWRTRQGLVFEATFAGAQLQGWRARPTHIHSLYLVKWAEATEAAQILERLEAANAKLRAP